MARNMLNNKKLPNDYWAKAVAVVVDVYILNISPTKAVRKITHMTRGFIGSLMYVT